MMKPPVLVPHLVVDSVYASFHQRARSVPINSQCVSELSPILRP